MPDAPAVVTLTAKKSALTEDQVNEIMALHYEGTKPTPIARAVFGYVNSDVVCKVRDVISEYDDADDDDGAKDDVGDL